MDIKKPFVAAIAAVSGGGKTTVTKHLNQCLPQSAALYFDDYDLDESPDDICEWVERGADYNEWKLTPLIHDLHNLVKNPSQRLDYILLDYPFAYVHSDMRPYIDFTIFIDTPLDIAMARRLLRDYQDVSSDCIRDDIRDYLLYGRAAYLEMLNTIRPNCDLILDGSLPLDKMVNEISKAITIAKTSKHL